MLPKSRRLTAVDFKGLRSTRVLHTPHFLVRLTSVSAGQTGRAAVVVSAASYKRAVDRNLLRRRMYSIIEKQESLLRGLTIVVTFKNGSLSLSFKELEETFRAALSGKR